MTPEQLEYFKKVLTDEKNKILDEAESTVHDMQSESSLFADPSDRASMETERITTLRIRDRERKLIFKVQDALERIQDGTFGACEECGEEIGFKRLEIRPVTTYCIRCKEEQEEEEQRYSS